MNSYRTPASLPLMRNGAVPRRARYSARPFYLSLLVISALCAVSFIRGYHGLAKNSNPGSGLVTRGLLAPSVASKKDCHLVHRAVDKCDFVRKHCPDEEAGIFSYLSLYYCDLPSAQVFAFSTIVLWLCLLFSTIGIAASDFFCVNLSTIASLLGMSESLAGVTFLAFGNGSSDVFSTFAAMNTNSGSLAVGELIGAAGFITTVVAGSMALVRPFRVARKSFIRDVGFFIVAAVLTLTFLLDGQLSVWESASMVLFYLFYVVFIIIWHWWISKSRARKFHESASRNIFNEHDRDIEHTEPYRDEEYSEPPHPIHSRTTSDLAALQAMDAEASNELNADEAEEDRERLLGELSNNMRLSSRKVGERRSTIKPPIRPSLVGALEFRAALASFDHSHSNPRGSASGRRHSFAPQLAPLLDPDQLSTISDPLSRSAHDVTLDHSLGDQPTSQHLGVQTASGSRARAVSTNDLNAARPAHDILGFAGVSQHGLGGRVSDRAVDNETHRQPLLPTPVISLSLTPAPAHSDPRIPKFTFPVRSDLFAPPQVDGHLAPPESADHQRSSHNQASPGSISPLTLPPQINEGTALPKLQIPPSESGLSSPVSPFPTYTDDLSALPVRSRASSIRLPPSTMPHSPFELYNSHFLVEEDPAQEWKWWPYRFLPAPGEIMSTLFPTLYNWKAMTLWERFLGVVAAPSVFLLTITLPVVETSNKLEGDEHQGQTWSLPPSGQIRPEMPVSSHSYKGPITILEPGSSPARSPSPFFDPTSPGAEPATAMKGLNGNTTHVSVATTAQGSDYYTSGQGERHPLLSPSAPQRRDSPPELPGQEPCEQTWNRWLLLVQCVTSPPFTACVVYINFFSDDYGPRLLLTMFFWSLLASAIFVPLVLLTSTPTQPPRWRPMLCFVGFVVSVCWISTVANEVVGVLKWLGIILNMSEAILGLTIFAVGNSLGDLVADITVARLGYPVMALSACFGGPMLNILLGIGLSGLYMTIHGAKERGAKHPGQPMKFKPFHIDVSNTLWISGLSLLVTLCVLLVVVPARKWKMDRAVGFGLMGLWVASTTVNVVLEVLGVTDDIG